MHFLGQTDCRTYAASETIQNWIAETWGVKERDILLLFDPKKRGMLPLVQITEVQRGIAAKVRRVIVFDGFTHFGRASTFGAGRRGGQRQQQK
jgi:hypothetical protein